MNNNDAPLGNEDSSSTSGDSLGSDEVDENDSASNGDLSNGANGENQNGVNHTTSTSVLPSVRKLKNGASNSDDILDDLTPCDVRVLINSEVKFHYLSHLK